MIAPGYGSAGPESSGNAGTGRESLVRFKELAAIAADLAAATTVVDVVDLVTSRLKAVMSAAIAAVMLVEGENMVVVADTGITNPDRWRRFPLTTPTPVSDAVRSRSTVVVAGLEEVARRYPDLADSVAPGRTIVCIPMAAERVPLGALALTFDEDWVPGEDELGFLETYANSSAQAIRRIEATQAAARRARRLDFLAMASEELAGDLDLHVTLQKVAELVVPDLADWCLVSLLDHGALRTVAVAHTDPEKVAWAWRYQEAYPPDMTAATGIANVIRTGHSELYEQVTDEMIIAASRDEAHLHMARQLGLRSAMAVALQARGTIFGAITLVRSDGPDPFGAEELAVARDLARRAGLAIDNATLYTQTRDVALQLQRAVLPDALEVGSGWAIAPHYRPGHRAEVGGDFYDAIELDDGRLAVFVGDVMGHGIAAAAAMASIRSAVRAYLSIDPDPAVVAARLDTMFAQLRIEQLVTLVYGVLDAPAGDFSFVNAGHHAPLVVAADGAVRSLDTRPARPLGAGGDTREATRVAFCAGDTLLVFTDGLVERRGEVIDEGIARLVGSAAALNGAHLQAALDRLVEDFDENLDDDVTVLAVRRLRGTGDD